MQADIKLVAIDLDDTLLRDDISISDYTKEVLQKVKAQGVRIVIATGRMFKAARPWGVWSLTWGMCPWWSIPGR